jgi:hypothetical protein
MSSVRSCALRRLLSVCFVHTHCSGRTTACAVAGVRRRLTGSNCVLVVIMLESDRAFVFLDVAVLQSLFARIESFFAVMERLQSSWNRKNNGITTGVAETIPWLSAYACAMGAPVADGETGGTADGPSLEDFPVEYHSIRRELCQTAKISGSSRRIFLMMGSRRCSADIALPRVSSIAVVAVCRAFLLKTCSARSAHFIDEVGRKVTLDKFLFELMATNLGIRPE